MKKKNSEHPIALMDIGDSFQTRNTDEKCIETWTVMEAQRDEGKSSDTTVDGDSIYITRTG